MRLALPTLVGACALALYADSALAVPVTTSFTARLQDSSGPIDGSVSLTFRLYDAPANGTLVWEETHADVTASAGMVFVALGSVAPTTNGLDASVFDGGDKYLEVVVDGDVQSPRVPILSVPYALRASTADTLGDLGPNDVALKTHNHDSQYAALGHNHDSDYAALSHNHDSQYAALSHNHDSHYAALSHNHDTKYAALSHNHDSQYAALSHSHGSADIIDNSLTANDLAANSVTSSELSNNAVTSAKIADHSITGDDVGIYALDERHIKLPSGYTSVTATLTSGANYLTPSAASITSSYVTTCTVHAKARVYVNPASGYMTLQPTRVLEGSLPSPAGMTDYASKGQGTYYHTASSMMRWSQGAGNHKFGCRIYATGDFIGKNATCYVMWQCD